MLHSLTLPNLSLTPLQFGIADSAASAALTRLVARIQDGDRSALDDLFAITSAQVRKRARSIVRNTFDADDVVADVFEAVWKQARAYDPARGCVVAWLLMMCRSRALDLLRQGRVRRAHFALLACETRDDALTPVDLDFESERHVSVLREQIPLLSAVRRQVIDLAFFRGFSHIQIAALLDVPLGTVKSHLRRALQELHGFLSSVESDVRLARALAATKFAIHPALSSGPRKFTRRRAPRLTRIFLHRLKGNGLDGRARGEKMPQKFL